MAKPKKLKKIDELKLYCNEEMTFNLRSLLRSYNVVDIESGRSYSRKSYRARCRRGFKNGYEVMEIKIIISGTRYQLCVLKPYKVNSNSYIFEDDEVIIGAIYQMKNGSFYRNIIAGNSKYVEEEEMRLCNTTN
jgi:hypothetical protein